MRGMTNHENPQPAPVISAWEGQIFESRLRQAAGAAIRKRISVPVDVV